MPDYYEELLQRWQEEYQELQQQRASRDLQRQDYFQSYYEIKDGSETIEGSRQRQNTERAQARRTAAANLLRERAAADDRKESWSVHYSTKQQTRALADTAAWEQYLAKMQQIRESWNSYSLTIYTFYAQYYIDVAEARSLTDAQALNAYRSTAEWHASQNNAYNASARDYKDNYWRLAKAARGENDATIAREYTESDANLSRLRTEQREARNNSDVLYWTKTRADRSASSVTTLQTRRDADINTLRQRAAFDDDYNANSAWSAYYDQVSRKRGLAIISMNSEFLDYCADYMNRAGARWTYLTSMRQIYNSQEATLRTAAANMTQQNRAQLREQRIAQREADYASHYRWVQDYASVFARRLYEDIARAASNQRSASELQSYRDAHYKEIEEYIALFFKTRFEERSKTLEARQQARSTYWSERYLKRAQTLSTTAKDRLEYDRKINAEYTREYDAYDLEIGLLREHDERFFASNKECVMDTKKCGRSFMSNMLEMGRGTYDVFDGLFFGVCDLILSAGQMFYTFGSAALYYIGSLGYLLHQTYFWILYPSFTFIYDAGNYLATAVASGCRISARAVADLCHYAAVCANSIYLPIGWGVGNATTELCWFGADVCNYAANFLKDSAHNLFILLALTAFPFYFVAEFILRILLEAAARALFFTFNRFQDVAQLSYILICNTLLPLARYGYDAIKCLARSAVDLVVMCLNGLEDLTQIAKVYLWNKFLVPVLQTVYDVGVLLGRVLRSTALALGRGLQDLGHIFYLIFEPIFVLVTNAFSQCYRASCYYGSQGMIKAGRFLWDRAHDLSEPFYKCGIPLLKGANLFGASSIYHSGNALWCIGRTVDDCLLFPLIFVADRSFTFMARLFLDALIAGYAVIQDICTAAIRKLHDIDFEAHKRIDPCVIGSRRIVYDKGITVLHAGEYGVKSTYDCVASISCLRFLEQGADQRIRELRGNEAREPLLSGPNAGLRG